MPGHDPDAVVGVDVGVVLEPDREAVLVTLDFFVCNFVIAPAVISFWRGVWDYSLIYLEERLLNV